MRWDLTRSSLGDSPKESGSSLGMRREIVGKKIGGLAARLPEYAGGFDIAGRGMTLVLQVSRFNRSS
ncbi:hypothetical protein GW17_00056447 [Ensete ventricosum]|nr:hypothetical protein GW17_00056447 [Ensete ventricosum]